MKTLRIAMLLLTMTLAACAGLPPSPQAQVQPQASVCHAGEASYDCQVERYHNVNAP